MILQSKYQTPYKKQLVMDDVNNLCSYHLSGENLIRNSDSASCSAESVEGENITCILSDV